MNIDLFLGNRELSGTNAGASDIPDVMPGQTERGVKNAMMLARQDFLLLHFCVNEPKWLDQKTSINGDFTIDGGFSCSLSRATEINERLADFIHAKFYGFGPGLRREDGIEMGKNQWIDTFNLTLTLQVFF